VFANNLPFEARIDNSGGSLTQVNGFGPWYAGTSTPGFSLSRRHEQNASIGGSYACL